MENILIPSHLINATNAARATIRPSQRILTSNKVPSDQNSVHADRRDLTAWDPLSNILSNGSEPYNALGIYEGEPGMKYDSMEERLFRDFKRVDTMRYVRPIIRNSTGGTRINVSLSLLKINDMVDRDEKLTTTVQLKVEWSDYRLRWNKTKYGDLQAMHLPAEMLWMPELELMNGFGYTHIDISKQMVRVFYNGTVSIKRVLHLETSCTLDVTFYPYDFQTCNITIGSWNWNVNELLFSNNGMSADEYELSMLWILVGTWNQSMIRWIMNETESDGFSCVVFTLYLEREDLFYSVHLIWPTIVIALMTCLAFFLPGAAGETIGLAVSLLLTFTVYLLFTADKMPENSRSMPLLGIILMILLMFSASSILFNVILLVWHHLGDEKEMNICLRKCVFDCIGRVTCKYLLDEEPTRKISRVNPEITGKKQFTPGTLTTNLNYDANTINRPENEITVNAAYLRPTRTAPSDQLYPALPVPNGGNTVLTPIPAGITDPNIDTFEKPRFKYKLTYNNAAKIVTRFIGFLYFFLILGGVILSSFVITNLPSPCWKNEKCTLVPESVR